MPSFARDEENCPVSAPALTSPATSALPAGTPAVFGKAVASRITSRALAAVDANAAHPNGLRPIRYAPPPPSSPPPSPPARHQKLKPADAERADDRALFFPHPRSPTLSDDDASSAASSADMNGHGDSSRGGSGGASSQTTSAPPEDDLRLEADACGSPSLLGKDGRGARTPSLTSSLFSPESPVRAPPPPPSSQKPPSSSAPDRAVAALPESASSSGRPAHPTMPPPPPPKPDALSWPSKPLPNGGPVSVPNPMAIPERTRVVLPQSQSQPLPSPYPPPPQLHQQTLRPWGNGPSTGDVDDAYPRHSVASTTASSIRPVANGIGGDASSPSNPQLLQAGPSSVPPHRFSSPPAYNAAASGSGSGSGGGTHLAPGGGLKHRHTLEVPKPAAGRNSRDSQDAAGGVFASGRFSPTAVGGGAGSGSVSGTGSISGRRASLSLVRRTTRSLHSELPRDEVVPDEDALRWAEAYRQKRASKKRRMEQDDDQVLVGIKVDETHQNWVAAYNMLTGIRVSVSRTNAKLDRPLTDDDFDAKQKSTFDIAGNELVPSAKYDFKFKDYAPWVFRHLRALFHLDPADYLMSLAGKYILSELGSPGKSGSFFYFSRDYRYIIKTIHHAEHKFLRKILKDYYKHVTENPNTLLSQFFGLHRVKMPYGRKIHFVVMNNLFPPHRDIHETFDLKGSTIGRDYPEELLAKNPRATLKDLNWLRRHQHLELGIIKKRLFLEQLRKDVQLLQRLQIMDYSLLVGTHDLRRGNDENLRGKILQVFEPGGDAHPEGAGADPPSVLMRTPSKLEHQRKTRELRQMLKSERPIPIGQSSNKMPDELDDNKQSIFYQDDGGFQATHQDNTPAEEVYYLGVIDCLTHYGMVKKIEHFWKGLSHDRNEISALPPQQYGERFLKFMSGITMSPEDVAREAQDRAQQAAAAAADAAAGTSATANDNDHDASGRDMGKNADQPGRSSWSSHFRHRSGASGHTQRNSDGGREATATTTAAHRAAEDDALQTSPAANDGEATQTTIALGGGLLVPGLVSSPNAGPSLSPASAPSASGLPVSDRRESMQQPVLPIVDEAGESSSTGGRSHSSRFSTHTTESDSGLGRPTTPAKDGARFGRTTALVGGAGSASLGGGGDSPPTPPATGYLKPESADSGYGVSGTRSRSGTLGSGRKVRMQLSRESLHKELPPLPRTDAA